MALRRVVVIGCGGAGKSTFACRLGEKLDIPVHHLDRVFWQEGWVPSDRDAFLERLRKIAEQPAWIMDGHFGGTLDYRLSVADAVVFLDYPTHVCLGGAIRRYFAWRGRSRPDMTEGNQEKLDRSYLQWIISFRRSRRPQLMGRLSRLEPAQAVYQFVNRSQADRFLEEVTPQR